MSNNQFKTSVVVQNNPTYSLTIEGLTQEHIDRLHALFNHFYVMNFMESESPNFDGVFSEARKRLAPFKKKELFEELDTHLKKHFGTS